MNLPVSQLLGQGLIITAIGLGLVFAALALLWGLIGLLGKILPAEPDGEPAPLVVPNRASGGPAAGIVITPAPGAEAAAQAEESWLAERARVAAIVASALLANALPLHFEPPAGPAFEHGRTAPSWVTSNRARTFQSWQPPRWTETTTDRNG